MSSYFLHVHFCYSRDENNSCWPFANQFSNIATHFLICLTYFRSNKKLCMHKRLFRFDTFQCYCSKYTIIWVASRWASCMGSLYYGIWYSYLIATNNFVLACWLVACQISHQVDLTFGWLLSKPYFHSCIHTICNCIM